MSDLIDRQAAIDEMSNFEKQIHNMFDHIWDCEIEHPFFQDTVGELMQAVIQCYQNLPHTQPDFDIEAKIDKAYDDGYEAGYLQGRHDWGNLDE